MNKAELKKYLKDLKVKQKEEKIRYKATRPPFKKRMNGHLIFLAIRFNNARKKVIGVVGAILGIIIGIIFTSPLVNKVYNKVHAKRIDIDELKVKLNYIVDSLRVIAIGTDTDIRKELKNIVDNIDDL